MRTTAEETERNNQKILDAAMEIFAKYSYDSVNMQDIADAAGISRGPLYYRYKTKAELFRAAYEAYMERDLQEYRRIFSQEKPILEMFREDLLFCTSSAQMEHMANWNQRVAQTGIEELQKKSLVYEQEVFQIKVEAVERAIARGELREDTEIRQFVNLIFIFAEGLFVMVHYRSFEISRSEIEEYIERMLEGLQREYGNDGDREAFFAEYR